MKKSKQKVESKEYGDVTKRSGFKFWGEDEAEDQELMLYAFVRAFGENWNSKEDEEAFAYLQEK